ncbi:MAG: Dyp-type peroxidase, partial [Blastocatellia bacterium]
MAVDLTATGIDLFDPKYEQALIQLQGNILKAHGRNFSTHLVLRFTAQPKAVKEWIQNFARARLTSAKKQLEEAKRFRETGQPGDLFVSVFLSATGYKHLGFDPRQFEEENDTFRLGMKERRRVNIFFPNKDPRVPQWEEVYQGEIHALIMLADDSPDQLRQATEATVTSLAGVAQILATEHGNVIRDAK